MSRLNSQRNSRNQTKPPERHQCIDNFKLCRDNSSTKEGVKDCVSKMHDCMDVADKNNHIEIRANNGNQRNRKASHSVNSRVNKTEFGNLAPILPGRKKNVPQIVPNSNKKFAPIRPNSRKKLPPILPNKNPKLPPILHNKSQTPNQHQTMSSGSKKGMKINTDRPQVDNNRYNDKQKEKTLIDGVEHFSDRTVNRKRSHIFDQVTSNKATTNQVTTDKETTNPLPGKHSSRNRQNLRDRIPMPVHDGVLGSDPTNKRSVIYSRYVYGSNAEDGINGGTDNKQMTMTERKERQKQRRLQSANVSINTSASQRNQTKRNDIRSAQGRRPQAKINGNISTNDESARDSGPMERKSITGVSSETSYVMRSKNRTGKTMIVPEIQ